MESVSNASITSYFLSEKHVNFKLESSDQDYLVVKKTDGSNNSQEAASDFPVICRCDLSLLVWKEKLFFQVYTA